MNFDTANHPLLESDSLSGLAGAELRSVDRVVALFQLRLLPPTLWTHRVRMAIGLRYVLRYGFEEGLRRVRRRSRDYHRAMGTAGEYHETETVYSVWVVSEFLRRHPLIRHRILLYRRLLEDRISAPGLLARAYSVERLNDGAARHRFVSPDLTPLPAPVRERLIRVSARQACRKREPTRADSFRSWDA